MSCLMSCELNIVASLSEQNSDGLTLPEKAFFRNSFETHPNDCGERSRVV
jgi:hypothetical protein